MVRSGPGHRHKPARESPRRHVGAPGKVADGQGLIEVGLGPGEHRGEVIATFVVAISLIVDLGYGLLDPRVRAG